MATKKRRIFRPTDEAGVERQRMMADAMTASGMEGPPNSWDRMPVTPTYGLGNALADAGKQMAGAYLTKQANDSAKDIDAAKRKRLADAMGIDSMTKGYDTPEDGVGPVRDPDKRAAASKQAAAMRTFNELVPIDKQTEILGAKSFAEAFPAPKKLFSGTVGKDEDAYVDGVKVASGARSAIPDTRTDDVREFEYAVDGGYKGSFAQWQKDNKAGTTVNIDNTPKPPPGFIRKTAPNGDTYLVREKGGPAEEEMRQIRAKATASMNGAMTGFQRLHDTITKLENGNVKGITGIQSVIPNWPGGSAANAKAYVTQLMAQSGFKELSDMRAASPTGGALGSITERELSLLQNTAMALDQSQSEEQFRANLKEFKLQLERSAVAIHEAYQQDFGQTAAPGAGAGAGNGNPNPTPPTGANNQRPQIGPNSAPPGQRPAPSIEARGRADRYKQMVVSGG